MAAPAGFEYEVRGSEVVIFHRGKKAAVLRAPRARDFLDSVAAGDPQQLMARLTGNYKRGNERAGKRHPRNRG